MALSGPQFDYFVAMLDVMEPDLTSVKAAVEAAAVDLATLETLITTTNTKLDSVISALATVDTSIGTLDTSVQAIDGQEVLGKILAEAVGVRNAPLE